MATRLVLTAWRSAARLSPALGCSVPSARLRAVTARLASVARHLSLAASCCVAALFAVPAHAFDAEQLVATEIPSAHLVGHGSFSRLGFHLYDAELFSGPGPESVASNWSAHPLVLDLRYAHAFSSHLLVDRTVKEMEKLKVASEAQRQRWADELTGILPNVAVGQHLTGVFRPGDGTRFYSDGKLIGHIAGDDFARAFFAIWLDPHTSAPDLRAELISEAR